MKIKILIICAMVATASAQTNSTNVVAHKSAPKRIVVTKAMVLAGLKTLDGQIKTLSSQVTVLNGWAAQQNEKGRLQYDAGQIGGAEANNIRLGSMAKVRPLTDAINRQISAIKLQQFEILQRYAWLLKSK